MQDLLGATRSMLATSVDRWTALARVRPDLLARCPAAGEWSAIQCLQHVVDTEAAVFHARVVAILEGRDFVGYDPDAEGSVDRITATAAQLAAALAPMREASLATLGRLVAADLERTARHAELGTVTMAELLNEWAAHDTVHLVQAERALMQAFIPGSGPWRPYFEEHDVGAAPSR